MKTKKGLNPYLLVILSFVQIIFVGAILLMMPFSRTAHNFGNFLDCLFLATSATCVTGLNSFANGIGQELTFVGQLIVLAMIQVGGLGFITVLTFAITLFYRKLQFKDRLFISLMVNSEDTAEVVSFVRKIILISASFELLGFLLGLPVFLNYCDNIPQALWYSLFTSISSYNNAGFDLFGSTSLIRGAGTFVDTIPDWAYYYMCSYIMFLIVAGGISFLVVMDLFAKRNFKQLRVFTKIALMMTGILLSVGFVVFIFSDSFSPNVSVFDALFQSVTCRTAGFATINQDELSVLGKAFSCFLMFFGGNPLGTAGGVKTTTLYIIVLAMVCYLTGRKVTSFHRRYSNGVIVKAMSLVILAVTTIFISFLAVYAFEEKTNMTMFHSTKTAAILYEIFSAFGTVGVSTGITPLLTPASKIVICILMFIGRLGPITFFQLIGSKLQFDDGSKFHYVEEDFLIG